MSETSWVGTSTDGSLGANWSNGLPDAATINAILDGTSTKSIASGFGAIRARGTLTSPGSVNFAADDTVVLDTKTYIFKASPSADGEVDVGADVETSLDNLMAAINLETPIGGKYGASMTLHPTVTALSSTATTLVVAAKDGGTGGNSIASTVGGGNTGDATWGAATLAGGVADGATMGNIDMSEDYPGSIHTSGTKAPISCGSFEHRGSGQINIDIVNCTRMIIASINYALAADLVMSSSLVQLEIVKGRVQLECPAGTAMPNRIIVADSRTLSENLRLTGSDTLTGAQLIIGPGRVSVDGPDWTTIDNYAGQLTIEDGIVATLRSTGIVTLKTTDTMTLAYIMGGELDLTQGAGGKTVTNVILGPLANFVHRGTDIDTFILTEIGQK
jgi:hypothetical protein